MSNYRDENAPDKFVKQYISARLEQAAHSIFLGSSDDLVDYLNEKGGLDRPCTEWIENASNGALRELLKVHQKKYNQYHAGAGTASFGSAGPSAQGFVDSAYDPGSPMSADNPPRETKFNVALVPAAAPDAEPMTVLGRIDSGSNINTIDYDIATSLCGNRIREGQVVRVGCQHTQGGQDGTYTQEIQCIVGRIPEVNIIFARDFGRSKARSEFSVDRGSLSSDRELNEEWAKNAVFLIEAKTRQDLLRKRNRHPDDDDSGQRMIQRPRTGE